MIVKIKGCGNESCEAHKNKLISKDQKNSARNVKAAGLCVQRLLYTAV